MSSDIRVAFAHPSERADATSTLDPRDRISVRDYIVDIEIGAFQLERDVVQQLRFNVVVEVIRPTDEIDDDVDRILSYDRVTEAVDTALAQERMNLLETVAERVASLILAQPQAHRVFVRIEKDDRGPFALGVEIVRSRENVVPVEAEATTAPAAELVLLSNDAIASGHVSGWIDQLGGGATPLVFAVGLPPQEVAQVDHARAQTHIDLLAIDQNAWRLAALDDRFAVVQTRTELDWAMKHGQICIWAPSKMVLDAVDGPEGDLRDLGVLANWFSGEFNVVGAVAIDVALSLDVTMRTCSITASLA